MAYTNGNSNDTFHTPLTRYYVDVRPHAPISAKMHLSPPKRLEEDLPLLHTLPLELQESIKKYVRKPDRFMSLASALLKYLFIHRTAKIPWSEVKVSRTPKPHGRPYWSPPQGWVSRKDGSGQRFEGLEFNVSHQAGVVVLVGCGTPTRPRDARVDEVTMVDVRSLAVINPDPTVVGEFESEIDEDAPEDVRIGVDVACTHEPPRTPDLSTHEKLVEWVEVFGEMFSQREQHDMINVPIPGGQGGHLGGLSVAESKARRFYTYWALKEAYIKMVGEGLLAGWLRDLEFRDVVVPRRPDMQDGKEQWTIISEEEVQKLGVLFKGKNITKSMTTTLEAFEDTFLVTTMTRGVVDTTRREERWQNIDLFGDIELCATGKCRCLG